MGKPSLPKIKKKRFEKVFDIDSPLETAAKA